MYLYLKTKSEFVEVSKLVDTGAPERLKNIFGNKKPLLPCVVTLSETEQNFVKSKSISKEVIAYRGSGLTDKKKL